MKEDSKRNSSGSISNLLFLAGGLALVATLAYFKAKEAQEFAVWKDQRPQRKISHSRIPRWEIASLEVELDSHRVAIAKNPISQDEFRQFVEATGYVTWRERWGYQPYWQESADDSMALWLCREDAELYCKWLAKVTHTPSPYPRPRGQDCIEKSEGFRLPSKLELDALEDLDPKCIASHWEWTANSLRDFDPERANAKHYLTARGPKGVTRHRRAEDMGHRDVQATGFRLAWTVP